MPTCKIITLEKDQVIIEMKDMKPLQWGIVTSGTFIGHTVMRTADSDLFEVIDLISFRADYCWNKTAEMKVKLGKGVLTLKITND